MGQGADIWTDEQLKNLNIKETMAQFNIAYRPKQTFIKKTQNSNRYTVKVVYITNQHRNKNQSHNKLIRNHLTLKQWLLSKRLKIKVQKRMWRKMNICTLMVGM
jgi:hypothetical protein